MTIEKAIPLIQAMIDGCSGDEMQKYENALRLGIEALKRVKLARDTPSGLSFSPLPGETKE